MSENMGGRRKIPADDAALLVNPQVRTRPGAPANFRLWQVHSDGVVRFLDDRHIELDPNTVERSIRGLAQKRVVRRPRPRRRQLGDNRGVDRNL
jgi:hypothetical protein